MNILIVAFMNILISCGILNSIFVFIALNYMIVWSLLRLLVKNRNLTIFWENDLIILWGIFEQ